MHSVETHRRFDFPAQVIWSAFDDFGGIHKFHPLIESSPTTSRNQHGLGCERVCNMYGGGALKERIVGYEPGRRMQVEIYDAGPFPLKHAVAELLVVPEGANRSKVTFGIRFSPKFGPLGWLLAKLMMRAQFKKMLNQLLEGLDDHLRTGRLVGRNGVLVEATA